MRPILILRRAMDENSDPFLVTLARKATKNLAQIAAVVLILTGLAAIATTLSDSATVGRVFSLGLVAVLLVLLAACAALLAWVAPLPSKDPDASAFYSPSRAGEPLPARKSVGGSVGGCGAWCHADHVGVSCAAGSCERATPVERAKSTQRLSGGHHSEGSRRRSKTSEGATKRHCGAGASSRRLLADRCDRWCSCEQGDTQNFPRRMLRTISITSFASAPAGTTVTEGKWWDAKETKPVVAIGQRTAERLGVHAGSKVTFAAQDAELGRNASWP